MSYIYQTGMKGRTIFARILPGSELIESIKKICMENNIEIAYISTCIGSLEKVSFVYAVKDEERYYKIKYHEPVVMIRPIEFLGAQGIIARNSNGEYQGHFHAQFSDENMNVYGGHLLDSGNIVLATIELILNEIIDVKIKREYHKASGFSFFEPTDKE